jgi:hypothetical protein
MLYQTKNCVLGRSYFSILWKMSFWNEISLLSTEIVFRQQSPIQGLFSNDDIYIFVTWSLIFNKSILALICWRVVPWALYYSTKFSFYFANNHFCHAIYLKCLKNEWSLLSKLWKPYRFKFAKNTLAQNPS